MLTAISIVQWLPGVLARFIGGHFASAAIVLPGWDEVQEVNFFEKKDKRSRNDVGFVLKTGACLTLLHTTRWLLEYQERCR